MNIKTKFTIYLLILILVMQVGYSQQVKKIRLDGKQLITLLNKNDAPQSLNKQLNIPNNYEFQVEAINGTKDVTEFTDYLDYTHERYAQYYKGIKIEHSDIRVHYRGDNFVSANGEYINAKEIDISVNLSKEDAIQHAKKHISAKEYMWENETENNWLKSITNNEKESFYPNAEIVICKNSIDIEDTAFHIAYKIDIFAKKPLRHDYIYVDAKTGNILNILPILVNVNGAAQTRYSGTRAISTQQNGTTYRLMDYSRGNGIETYNLRNYVGTLDPSTYTVDFTDNDNNWTASEYHNANKDDAALDAHWGAMMTYDYFKNVHGRNSYDNNGGTIKNGVNLWIDAANWHTGYHCLILGEGNGTTNDSYVCLDVVAHEFAHGVCQFSAKLVYSGESGAINESLSDIWGACVENWATTNKQTWLIGEDAILQGTALRSMSNPATCLHPDTYGGGDYWTSANAEVHINSGIMNHWFYILSIGKAGTNGIGNSYNVTGIGIDQAAKIAYLAETAYMTANTDFADARTCTMQAAQEIYGYCSPEAIAVANAWHAVGVGSRYINTDNFINQIVGPDTIITSCGNINVQNVEVQNNAKLELNSIGGSVNLNAGFEVESGAEFEINIMP